MKGLSLTQPWATLIAIGAKRVETRSWSTTYRGAVAIHAAKGYPKWARDTCAEEPFYGVLQAYGEQWIREHAGDSPRVVFENPVIPTGMIIAVARLACVLPTEEILKNWDSGASTSLPHERDFGDYSPGRFGWLLSNVRRLPAPIPCLGSQGLWITEHRLSRATYEQLEDFAAEIDK